MLDMASKLIEWLYYLPKMARVFGGLATGTISLRDIAEDRRRNSGAYVPDDGPGAPRPPSEHHERP